MGRRKNYKDGDKVIVRLYGAFLYKGVVTENLNQERGIRFRIMITKHDEPEPHRKQELIIKRWDLWPDNDDGRKMATNEFMREIAYMQDSIDCVGAL